MISGQSDASTRIPAAISGLVGRFPDSQERIVAGGTKQDPRQLRLPVRAEESHTGSGRDFSSSKTPGFQIALVELLPLT